MKRTNIVLTDRDLENIKTIMETMQYPYKLDTTNAIRMALENEAQRIKTEKFVY